MLMEFLKLWLTEILAKETQKSLKASENVRKRPKRPKRQKRSSINSQLVFLQPPPQPPIYATATATQCGAGRGRPPSGEAAAPHDEVTTPPDEATAPPQKQQKNENEILNSQSYRDAVTLPCLVLSGLILSCAVLPCEGHAVT